MRRSRSGAMKGAPRIASAAGNGRLRLSREERKAGGFKKEVSHKRGMSYGREPNDRAVRPRR